MSPGLLKNIYVLSSVVGSYLWCEKLRAIVMAKEEQIGRVTNGQSEKRQKT